MANRCQVPANCIQWEMPEGIVCDPCLDISVNSEGKPKNQVDYDTFVAAFNVAAQIVYRKTGYRWPGECFIERTRPCLPACWCPAFDCKCGMFVSMEISDAFCLPVQEILRVNIGPNACQPDGAVWTAEDGDYRMEWNMSRKAELVLQDLHGCCGTFPGQDLCKPDGAPCTWSIDVRTGCAPPEDVLSATAAFAVEIVKECQQTGCGFARGATQVTTRGATFTRESTADAKLWLMILNDIYDEYKPRPADGYRAVCPDPEVEFHWVFGPVPLADCDLAPACEPYILQPLGV